jgi:DNA polymerase I-like protein with 3'-5' exonuclease and polymerase domains
MNGAEMLKDVMESAGKEFLKNVPVVAQVRIGDDWAG